MNSNSTAPAAEQAVLDGCLAGAVQLDGRELDERLAAQLPRWSVEMGRLRRSLSFASFAKSVAFATEVALLAERLNHHPTVTVDKRDVELELWTRKLSAVTTVDLDLAEAIEQLVTENAGTA